jgi:hypothetical protein
MPTTDDLATIIASLPPLTFTPADEAPVALGRWYIVTPADDDVWAIAHRTEKGWFAQDGLPREPLLCAALPAPPFTHPSMLLQEADDLAECITAGDLDGAMRLKQRARR